MLEPGGPRTVADVADRALDDGLGLSRAAVAGTLDRFRRAGRLGGDGTDRARPGR